MPVYLELPRDMVRAEVEEVPTLEPTPYEPEALAECADEILERLRTAEQPALMVGVEARRYRLEGKVAELAKRLDLPAVTSFMGRGLLAEPGMPLRGTYLGKAGDPGITRLIEGSDALLLMGVLLSDTNFGVSGRAIDLRRAIHACARDVRIGFHVYQGIPLEALIDALLERLPTPFEKPATVRPTAPLFGLEPDDQPVAPADIAAALDDMMAEHGAMPIASDVGDCLFTAMDMTAVPMVAPGYYAGMGFGVPAGIGLQAESGQRPLILVGDGAFQMTGFELGNCRRYGLDPIVVLFNNQSWEMLRAFQPESRFNDLDDWRFAEIAPALGGVGTRVATRAELKAALDSAVAERGRFHLIEVMLARGAMSPTLARFAKAQIESRETRQPTG